MYYDVPDFRLYQAMHLAGRTHGKRPKARGRARQEENVFVMRVFVVPLAEPRKNSAPMGVDVLGESALLGRGPKLRNPAFVRPQGVRE